MTSLSRRWICLGALLGALGVALGAFGAHGLPGATAWWRFAAWAFLVGIVLFSGSLKALTVAGPSWNWLGMVAPIGGISMIAGWVALAIGALRNE
jgi:uncharacterized membrane protein YgdD (TMEM256/DUF423 family)